VVERHVVLRRAERRYALAAVDQHTGECFTADGDLGGLTDGTPRAGFAIGVRRDGAGEGVAAPLELEPAGHRQWRVGRRQAGSHALLDGIRTVDGGGERAEGHGAAGIGRRVVGARICGVNGQRYAGAAWRERGLVHVRPPRP